MALALLLVFTAIASCSDDQPTGPGEFPDVRGSWISQYSVTDCQALTGIDPFFCTDVFFDGVSLALSLELNQSNERVTGNAIQGSIAGQVTGTVDMSGTVTLEGVIGADAIATTTIEEWETDLIGDSLVGYWQFLVEDNQDLGLGSASITATMTLITPSVPNVLGCPAQISLALTDSISGVLDAGDCMLNDTTYFDVFQMDVQAGDSVEFRLASQDFNPFLIVADIDGQPLQVAGTLGDSVASMGMLAAFDETWLVVANVLLPNDYGDYRLVTTDVSVATTSLQRVPSGERATLRGEDGSDWAASESSAHSLGGVFGSPDGAAAIKKLKGIE